MKKMTVLFLTFLLCFCTFGCSQKEVGAGEEKEIIEPVLEEPENPEPLPEFSVKDLEGSTVTNDIFSEADITVINFWATYCSPCINEMPELAEWSESMPENVRIIGIVTDVPSEDSDQYALAQQIVEKTGVKYANLVAGEEFNPVIREIVGVPTTFFVDKDGKFIGSPIVGADVAGYKSFVEGYLDALE